MTNVSAMTEDFTQLLKEGKIEGLKKREKVGDWYKFNDEELHEAWRHILDLINTTVTKNGYRIQHTNPETGQKRFLIKRWKNVAYGARMKLYTENTYEPKDLWGKRPFNNSIVFKLKSGQHIIIDDAIFAKDSKGTHGYDFLNKMAQNGGYSHVYISKPQKKVAEQKFGRDMYEMRLYIDKLPDSKKTDDDEDDAEKDAEGDKSNEEDIEEED